MTIKIKETPLKWNKTLISYLKKLNDMHKLEHFRKIYTGLDCVIKKRQKIKEQEKLKKQFSKMTKSVIFFGVINPILGVALNSGIEILA